MALVVAENPARVPLEVSWRDPQGAEKLDVVSCTATVYHRDNLGTRVVDLAPVSLVQDSGVSTWCAMWVAPTLAAGSYVIEYTATDAEGEVGKQTETLSVTASETLLDSVLDALLGAQKWDLTQSKWIMYKRDGSVLIEFTTKDSLGHPTTEENPDVFERVPIP